MPSCRLPGVLCQELNAAHPDIDGGTLARALSPTPGHLDDHEDDDNDDVSSEGFTDPGYAKIVDSVGNGFCVPLVQFNTAVGNTGTWKAGTAMSDRPNIAAGTVIATFNAEGKYESKARGNHAAFFVGYKSQGGVDGIEIYDQYREWPDKDQKVITDLELAQKKLLTTPGTKPEELAQMGTKLMNARKALESAFPEVDDKGRRFRRKQPGKRFIGFNQGTVSNNASSYSIVVH